MSQELNEDLSCLIDGELESDKSSFLLSRLSHDDELKSSWRRYHMYGEILRRESVCRIDLTASVAQAIEDEPDVHVDMAHREASKAQSPRWMRPVAGAAIAASVAVFAFNMFAPQATVTGQERSDSTPAVANSASGMQAPPPMLQQATPASASTASSAWSDPKLQSYIMRHNEAAARRGQGLVPFIYLVSTPADGNEASNESVTDGEPKDTAVVQQ